MFKKSVLIGFLFAIVFSSMVLAQASSQALTEKVALLKYVACTTCDDKEKPEQSALFEGKVYSFCGEAKCLQAFEKDPKKFAEKMKDAPSTELTLANAKGKCFVCEKPATAQFFKTTDDKIAFFCCADCKEKAKEDHTGHDHQKDPHGAHK